jgi:hypothetical protein
MKYGSPIGRELKILNNTRGFALQDILFTRLLSFL